jgi:signal transduction histidine kinase/FixJ family two-component response regulator
MTDALVLRALVVEDDADTRANLADILELDGWQVAAAGTLREALGRDDWADYAAVILDRRLPDGTAEGLLPDLRRLAPAAAVVVVTGHADVGGAVAALRLGAADYLLKPVDADELRARLGRIAETRRARHELRRQEDVLRLVLDTISDGVLVVDAVGRVVLSNPAMEAMLGPVQPGAGPEGWPQRGCVYRPDTVTPCPAEELALARALRGEAVHDAELFARPPGQDQGRWVSASATPLRPAAGPPQGAVVVARDITGRKRAEAALRQTNRQLEEALAAVQAKGEDVRAMSQQLWQAAKLATIGELAAGIAHELNNPLATVSLRVEALLAALPADHPHRRPLEVVEGEVERMANLVANLLQFSRRGGPQASTVDLPEELGRTLELVQHQFRRRGIEVRRELAADVPPVHADRQGLRQVFLNLLTNALDAMPQGGTLTLRAAAPPPAGAAPAEVVVEVADTGAGIPPEHLAKVTEPFFTTKEEGKGTGLGLAICKRIVQEHGGTLTIDSALGRGTTVRIALPAATRLNPDHLREP